MCGPLPGSREVLPSRDLPSGGTCSYDMLMCGLLSGSREVLPSREGLPSGNTSSIEMPVCRSLSGSRGVLPSRGLPSGGTCSYDMLMCRLLSGSREVLPSREGLPLKIPDQKQWRSENVCSRGFSSWALVLESVGCWSPRPVETVDEICQFLSHRLQAVGGCRLPACARDHLHHLRSRCEVSC